MIFITHDLRVAAQICDRIAVMKNGDVVEEGLTAEVFAGAATPYTQALLASVPGSELDTAALGGRARRGSGIDAPQHVRPDRCKDRGVTDGPTHSRSSSGAASRPSSSRKSTRR